MKPYYQDESVTIYHGDCRELLSTLPPILPTALVTDEIAAKRMGQEVLDLEQA